MEYVTSIVALLAFMVGVGAGTIVTRRHYQKRVRALGDKLSRVINLLRHRQRNTGNRSAA